MRFTLYLCMLLLSFAAAGQGTYFVIGQTDDDCAGIPQCFTFDEVLARTKAYPGVADWEFLPGSQPVSTFSWPSNLLSVEAIDVFLYLEQAPDFTASLSADPPNPTAGQDVEMILTTSDDALVDSVTLEVMVPGSDTFRLVGYEYLEPWIWKSNPLRRMKQGTYDFRATVTFDDGSTPYVDEFTLVVGGSPTLALPVAKGQVFEVYADHPTILTPLLGGERVKLEAGSNWISLRQTGIYRAPGVDRAIVVQ